MVIATHERSEHCRRAVASVLAQDPSPLEVLICDDGSGPATEARLRSLATADGRVRYLRVDPPAGRPAPARNLGVDQARGEWVAFLDDDDQWLPGKLAAQVPLMETPGCDVVASDAFRTSGGRYFGPHDGPFSPSRAMLVDANPIIMSTAVVRRTTLQGAGGFKTERWIGGLEDYDLWLRLANRGARFVVVSEALAIYDDAGSIRLSAARLRTQMRLARLKWRQVLASPRDGAAFRSALFETANSIRGLVKGSHRGTAARRGERAEP